MIQVCVASTLYGVATLAAAVDAGQLGSPGRRVLVVSNNAHTPEVQPGPDAQAGFDALATRFDAVVDWNAVVHPFHPGLWSPRASDAVLWERALRGGWQLGDEPLELVVESIQAPPAASLVRIFGDATVRLYADGLMTYGPTRKALPSGIGARITEVLYLELIPGLRPLLAREHTQRLTPIKSSAFTAVLGEVAKQTPLPELPEGGALILGQYLAAIGLLDEEQERALYRDMIRLAAAAGHDRVVFKPHPSAPAHWRADLQAAADAAGTSLTVVTTPGLAEALFARQRPAVVIGCFSTALITAQAFFDLPVAQVGTAQMLRRLTPFANSNRIPVVIVDAVAGDLSAGHSATRPGRVAVKQLQRTVETVGYCMQPGVADDLRDVAVVELRRDPGRYARLIPRQRLTRLGLPGGRVDLSVLLARPAVRQGVRQALAAPGRWRRRLARALA